MSLWLSHRGSRMEEGVMLWEGGREEKEGKGRREKGEKGGALSLPKQGFAVRRQMSLLQLSAGPAFLD